jgi:hypothetical protein
MLAAKAVSSRQFVPLVRTSKAAGGTFFDWVQTGLYAPISVGNVIELGNVDPLLCANALAGDVERLLKAGRETCAIIGNDASACSAWFGIKIYYAAFYYSSSLLRLCGAFPSYGKTSELMALRKALGAGGSPPPFQLKTGQYKIEILPNGRTIKMTKPNAGDGVHEYTWKQFIEFLSEIKIQIASGSFAPKDQPGIVNDLDLIIDAANGLARGAYLSSGRNDIQYRQKFSTWYPQSKSNKNYNARGRIPCLWSVESTSNTFDTKNTNEFISIYERCLLIICFCHRFVAELTEISASSFLNSNYIRYHRSLLR